MCTLVKTVAFVVAFAFAGSSGSAAFAETQWERNHPRRDQVNDRLANQNRRINHELKEERSPNNRLTNFTGKTAPFVTRNARWLNLMAGTSPRPSKRRSINRRTLSVARLAVNKPILLADHSKLSPRLLDSRGMKVGAACLAIKGRR